MLEKYLINYIQKLKTMPDESNLNVKLKPQEKNIINAVNKIYKAKKILIIGDKDVDGITSTVTMKKIVKNIKGDREVHSYIPSRYDGYSINFDIAKELVDSKEYDLIINLDNGSNLNYINGVIDNKLENNFIIIDHHPVENFSFQSVPEFLINPNIEGNVSTSTGLIVTHIYDVLYKYNQKNKIFNKTWEADYFDEIRVLSALADMVNKDSLYNRNQILKGIKKILKTDRFLYQNVKTENVIEELNFQIIPLINAMGRLAVTSEINGFDFDTLFFENEDKEQFDKIYKEIKKFNQFRKEITSFFYEEAKKEYNRLKKENRLNSIFVFYHENMPIGINGLIAQKIYQETQTPTICISPNPVEPNVVYGSGRGYMLKHAVSNIKKLNGIEFTYGGHIEAFGIQMSSEIKNEFIETVGKYKYDIQNVAVEVINDKAITIEELNRFSSVYCKITKGIPLQNTPNVLVKIDSAFIKKTINDEYVKTILDGKEFILKKSDFKYIYDKIINGENEFVIKLPVSDESAFLEIIKNFNKILNKKEKIDETLNVKRNGNRHKQSK